MPAKAKTVKRRITQPNASPLTPPRLGEIWPSQGGYFVGTVFGDGKPDYHLIVGPEMDGEADWNTAMKWAANLAIQGHKDYSLPNRREQRFLFCQAKHLHQETWYWSSEQHASTSHSAWVQVFDDGGQYDGRKGGSYRARAVRRLAI